ncbi:class I histocompatibility antigen, F10 alpha chain-like [Synchiropus splendidus]|uniref:class I histocompatibility antigen, F10 alpha chain-like n=1 Tax=Synchiropus splendidus TaxID=270530 RepID=UPI00237DE93A|nr:class I histocompatibility antigen, F10 alpha chain-like [Synchiropus splendidus]
MRLLVLLFLLEIHAAAAAPHSLRYFYTASSGVPDFPEFVAVGLVDDVQILHYDSYSRRSELRQDWMKQVIADQPSYLERETQNFFGSQQEFKNTIGVVKQRFNQTGGVHTYQRMFGCEWDDETEEVRGYRQDAYDGEDFIAFDLKTLTWIAATPQAVITKQEWDSYEGRNKYWQHYHTQECPEWLKKYLNYGKSRLLRTELPRVALLQKKPTSPIICHATGFYPAAAVLFWTKDGEELHEDVDMGEVLPNPDGTFQMTAELRLSNTSVDWGRYSCVFQLAGVMEDMVTPLRKEDIWTNREPDLNLGLIVGAVVAAVVALGLMVAGFFVYRRRTAKAPPSYNNASEEDLPLKPETRPPAPANNTPEENLPLKLETRPPAPANNTSEENLPLKLETRPPAPAKISEADLRLMPLRFWHPTDESWNDAIRKPRCPRHRYTHRLQYCTCNHE